MARPTGDQTADHYVAAHKRLAALAAELSDAEADTPVPATPGWSVRDIYAHLAAIVTDALAGRLTGIPDEAETARQIAERRGHPLADVVAEWSAGVGPMADGARAGLVPPNLAVDAITHEQDIRGALGRPRLDDRSAIAFCVDLYTYGVGRFRIGDDLAPLRVHSTDTGASRTAGKGAEPGATVSAPEFELFRALCGRRSRGQVEAFEWDGDAAPYLDRFNVFGALPTDDLLD